MPDDSQHPDDQPDLPMSGQVIQPTLTSSGVAYSQQVGTSTQPTQPKAGVDGMQAERKPSKWMYFFKLIGLLQVIGITFFLLVLFLTIRTAKDGTSGTEFIGMILFVLILLPLFVISLINFIGLSIYIWIHKPRGTELNDSRILLAISTLVVLYGCYNLYGFTASA